MEQPTITSTKRLLVHSKQNSNFCYTKAMRKAVLCFLKKDDSVLLLHTDYGNRIVWSGVSGYIEENETAVDAAIREVNEEIGVNIKLKEVRHVGTHDIFDVFIIEKWEGEPTPKEFSIKEIKWFQLDSLPYDQMHEGNEIWLPKLLI
jgi:8-oxo-dGTP diphosphatase